MGLIIKGYQHEIGTVSDKYIRIDSIRAGMGHDNTIACCCTEWLSAETRANNSTWIKANHYYHIPDGATVASTNLINAVYPLLKKYFQDQGLTVEDDLNGYGATLKDKE